MVGTGWNRPFVRVSARPLFKRRMRVVSVS